MTPRYKLRTLLILLAILPPLLAVGWWQYSAWRAEQEKQRALREARPQVQIEVVISTGGSLAPPAASPPQPLLVDGAQSVPATQP